jgi:hypothetical protein
VFQPPGNGLVTSETDACQSLRQAENAARTRLGCAASLAPECPAYVRPAGVVCGADYDRGTVDACVAWFGAAPNCDDIEARRCIVTMIAGTGAACAGAAGAAGSAGSGSGGMAGDGAGGAAGGAAGALGVAGAAGATGGGKGKG